MSFEMTSANFRLHSARARGWNSSGSSSFTRRWLNCKLPRGSKDRDGIDIWRDFRGDRMLVSSVGLFKRPFYFDLPATYAPERAGSKLAVSGVIINSGQTGSLRRMNGVELQ